MTFQLPSPYSCQAPLTFSRSYCKPPLLILHKVNGKVRSTLEVSRNITQDAAVEAALATPNVQKFIEGKAVKKVIFVAGKILNLIVA